MADSGPVRQTNQGSHRLGGQQHLGRRHGKTDLFGSLQQSEQFSLTVQRQVSVAGAEPGTEELSRIGGGDFFLVEDFINAIRTGEAPIVDVYTACEWTAVGLLSEISVVNNGRTLEVPKFRKGMTIEEKGIKL